MIIPNYIPQPLEVPGNVTEARFRDRRAFLAWTMFYWAASLALATVTALIFPVRGVWWHAWAALAGVLLLLCGWRVARRGQSVEARVSAWFLPIVACLAGWAASSSASIGYPLGGIAAAGLLFCLFGLLMGRDFSFARGFAAAGFFGSTGVLLWAQWGPPLGASVWWHIGWVWVTAFYAAYDMAYLLPRRRLGEEAAAVVDLYRDIFNLFGYIPRVIQHWHRHRIWIEVREEVVRSFGR